MLSPKPVDGRPPAEYPAPDAARELRSLLAVLTGVCESLVEGLDGQGEPRELARVGLRAARKASTLAAGLAAQAPHGESEAAGAPGPVVLIADDDPDLLKLITAAFARAGYRAYPARNGRLAAQLVRALKPDLLVTDIVMPEREGIATIIETKAVAPDTAVIAISGGGAFGRTDAFLQWATELGADEVVAKPFAMSRLLAAAEAVLERRGVRSTGRLADR
ncbi:MULTISPECIES: response regulator transcription factor [unclassified Phenylobacterium]|uniref:response regulator transcription factor n=1 Tax=unclassified Phenylobacterium TaxID=2640670 RepID=UPI000A58B693|nr:MULTISPECIES: response regulator [unclassified Phenylobacterium]